MKRRGERWGGYLSMGQQQHRRSGNSACFFLPEDHIGSQQTSNCSQICSQLGRAETTHVTSTEASRNPTSSESENVIIPGESWSNMIHHQSSSEQLVPSGEGAEDQHHSDTIALTRETSMRLKEMLAKAEAAGFVVPS